MFSARRVFGKSCRFFSHPSSSCSSSRKTMSSESVKHVKEGIKGEATVEGRSLTESEKTGVGRVTKKEGDRIPSVTFKVRVRDPTMKTDNPFKWKDVTSDTLFGGHRVVIFGLPGAFTPTCDASHVPGYHQKYADIRAQHVDEVYCVSVNDAFVMRQWGLSLGLQEEMHDTSNHLNPGNFTTVKMVPDGAAAFTRGMNMNCIWDVQRGFGERSWRYSMLVEDMVIKKLFIEAGKVTQNAVEDPFEVSDAETMLNFLKTRHHESFVFK